jgi:hypothetical protein
VQQSRGRPRPDRRRPRRRDAAKKDRHRLSNIPIASNQRDDAISQRITSGAVERVEAASARDQAERARRLDDSPPEGDNADPAT